MSYIKAIMRHYRKLLKKGGENMASKKWTLNFEDVKNVARGAFIFLIPVLIVELELLQKGASFEQLLIAFKVWAYGVVLGTLRSWARGK